jgi:hypothetical protein
MIDDSLSVLLGIVHHALHRALLRIVHDPFGRTALLHVHDPLALRRL